MIGRIFMGRQAKWRRLEPSEFPKLVPGKYRVKGKEVIEIEPVIRKASGTDDFEECASQTGGVPFVSERNAMIKVCMQKRGTKSTFQLEIRNGSISMNSWRRRKYLLKTFG